MHLLVLPSTYPSQSNPARGVFYRDQAQALNKVVERVGVLVAPQLKPKRLLLAKRPWEQLKTQTVSYDDKDIPVFETALWSWVTNLQHAAYLKTLSQATFDTFSNYCSQYGIPDLIHAHTSLYGGIMAAELKSQTGIPLVLTEHSTAFLTHRVKKRQLQPIRMTLAASDRVLAVGPALAKALEQIAPGCNVSVVGNMVDTEFFIPPEESLPARPFVFGSLGYLKKIKNFGLLIRAFSKAFKSQDAHLRIAGDGPEQPLLQKIVRELHIESQVTFEGSLSRAGVRSLIQSCHAIVSASWTETFGVTLIEALSSGKPVIATASGGPESFINEGNGLLIPVGDEAAMAHAMLQMFHGYGSYDGRAIRAECLTNFGEAAILEKLLGIYSSVLNRQ